MSNSASVSPFRTIIFVSNSRIWREGNILDSMIVGTGVFRVFSNQVLLVENLPTHPITSTHTILLILSSVSILIIHIPLIIIIPVSAIMPLIMSVIMNIPLIMPVIMSIPVSNPIVVCVLIVSVLSIH